MKRLLLYIAVMSVCLGLSAGARAISDPAPAADDHAQIEFLIRHWQVPIPPQGDPPAHFSSIEASIDPEGCAVCHRTQYEDWSGSLHSKSMGPGVRGQTMELIHDNPKMTLLCYSCHAPLTEQQEKVVDKGDRPSFFKRRRTFSTSLKQKGLRSIAGSWKENIRTAPRAMRRSSANGWRCD